MKVERKKIIKFCEEYLKVKDFHDKCVNGLQIEGSDKVGKIITGVSFSQKLIEKAIEKKAEMIIVHHGLFSEAFGKNICIDGYNKNRLKMILENNINVAGFHLPLDAHPEIGNNISLLKLFVLKKFKNISTPEYGVIGFVGEYEKAIEFGKFVELVNKKIGAKSYVISAGRKEVKRVGVISGAASPEFIDAVKAGADTYVTGDIRENLVRVIEETGINFVNSGHYNTEKLGVQNLGKLIAKKFKVEVEFVDIPCDI